MPALEGDALLDAWRAMLRSRVCDERCFSLQRQGRLGTFSPVNGEEAAVVGSAWALDPARDWIVPQYRELPAMLRFGYRLTQAHAVLHAATRRAAGWTPSVNVLPFQISLAAQIPHAVGLAWGLRHQGLDAVVCTYFGDGASSEGDAHEALNLAGVRRAPVVFVLKNNGWAISTPVRKQTAAASFAARAAGYGIAGELVDGNDLFAMHDACSRAVARARAGEGPTLIEARTYRMGPHNTSDDPTRYVDPVELEERRAFDPVARVRRYLTRRGAGRRGLRAARWSRSCAPRSTPPSPRPRRAAPPGPEAHLRPRLRAAAGAPGAPARRGGAGGRLMAEMTMIEAIRSTLGDALERDERVIVLGQDVGRQRRRLPRHRGPAGALRRGARGRHAAGRGGHRRLGRRAWRAAGMIPIPELQFLGFGSQAFHQIEGQVARYSFRSQGSYPMPMVIRAPFGGNVRTPELHSDAHEAKYANAPGLKVVMPATARDAKGLLAEAIRDPDPVLFCEPLRGYRLIKDEVPEEDYTVPLGKARIVREGSDLVIVAYSAAVVIAERAAERAAEEGYSVGVLDLRSLVPLDVDALREAVAACGRAVVLHEGSLTAGFGAELVATIQEEAFWSLQAPIGRVAAYDTPYPPGTIEELYVPSVDRVLDAIRAALEA